MKHINKKDKILAKDAALVVAEAVIDEIAKLLPGINIAWGLSKALYGAGMKLRQERVLEWVEMVRDNPTIFTDEILNDEKFQDGFVLALEKYMTERSEAKRKYFRKIFLGFTNAQDKEKFPLERFTHTLSQLGELDIATLKDVRLDETGQNYQIYGENSNRIDNIYTLMSQGILLDTTGGRIGHNTQNSPFVKPSHYGREFAQFIQEE